MENNRYQYIPIESEESDTAVDFQEFWKKCRSKWYWFLISVLLLVAVSIIFILTSRPLYSASSTILIKEASARRVATSDIESVLNFSGGTMSSKVVNEVIAFQSPALMMSVVERLGINTEYSVNRFLRSDLIYGSQVPIDVCFCDTPSTLSAKFVLTPLPDNPDADFVLEKLSYVYLEEKIKVDGVIKAHFGDTLYTDFGKITIDRNPLYTGEWEKPVNVQRKTVIATMASLKRAFKAEQEDVKNKSDVLRISIQDASISRGCDILNMMITVYNENWVEDKNRMAISTSDFIDDRLIALEKDLGDVDQDISSYKSSNLIPESKNVSDYIFEEGRDNTHLMTEIESQLYMFRYLRTFLKNNPGVDVVIPMSVNIGNSGIGSQIADYNRQILQRNNLQANSSEQNPVVKNLNTSLMSMRTAIESSIDNQVASLEDQLSELKQKERQATSRIAQTPSQTQYLTSVGRQQKVKETLYLYLLQKREENELSQAFMAYNTRVITPPMALPGKVYPKTLRMLLMSLLFGLLLPLVVLYLQCLFDNKVRTRHDVERMRIPFLGEIPQVGTRRIEKIGHFRHNVSKHEIIVKEGKRDALNESFRILRTNIEFLSKDGKCPVLLFTSFQPGSGKTFLSVNMGQTLAIKGKKVLVLDADMRHASLSEYVDSPRHGISDYLSSKINKLEDLVINYKNSPNLYVLPVGTIPPNPAELIGSERFATLLQEAKKDYDYIVIDCPPLDIVADTQVIHEYADRIIFVVRAGMFEKKMLPKVENLYSDGTFNNLCLILNGTNDFSSIYHNHYYNG